jgi:hypothetical protein
VLLAQVLVLVLVRVLVQVKGQWPGARSMVPSSA